jgi:7-cyano-7-deazaguanine synthase
MRFEEGINCGASWPVRIKLPFAGLDKSAVMESGRHLPLQHTFSCIAPVAGEHCGQCNKCAERQEAFATARIPDLTPYGTQPAAPSTGPTPTDSFVPVTGG